MSYRTFDTKLELDQFLQSLGFVCEGGVCRNERDKALVTFTNGVYHVVIRRNRLW